MEVASVEADSLDSAIDPEDHRAKITDDDHDGLVDSIVFKGKKIKKGSGFHSHHFSSVGNLLQVRRKIFTFNVHLSLETDDFEIADF